MKITTITRTALQATALLLGLLGGGCAADEDVATESTQRALTLVQEIKVGRESRFMEVVCRENCRFGPCFDDCFDDVQSVTLHLSEGGMRFPEPWRLFREHDGGPNWRYMGCGPQAVMNLASYFGRRLDIQTVYGVTRTVKVGWPWKEKDIMSTPHAVRDGFAYLMNDTGRRFRTVVHHGVTGRDIRRELLKGVPVIVLVDNGTHYVVVTGYRAPNNFFVIDYPGDFRWVTEKQLGLPVLGGPDLVEWIGFEGYEDNTMITTSMTDLEGQFPTGPTECPPLEEPCPGGQQRDPSTCSCACNAFDRGQCEANPDNIWDNQACTCRANR